MAEKAYPAAPANHGYQRSDAESLENADELKRKKKIKLAIYYNFRCVSDHSYHHNESHCNESQDPRFRLGNISVQSFESVQATPSFDTKFTTQIKIKNSANWGSYKFNAAIITFQYQGATLAVIDVAKGKAGWLSTIKEMRRLLFLHYEHQFHFSSQLGLAAQCQDPSAPLSAKIVIAWQCSLEFKFTVTLIFLVESIHALVLKRGNACIELIGTPICVLDEDLGREACVK
ncbi:uncharacterized protein Pyn_19765 [Prunus yedoensis var. nudiflora]|uniref:Late embryogenesis abundant protein LEA-2 subgroup domain-containing protein n=1 Tax=Prunus yedoensis var. nudiflora TaxID=2094558 RepID=A0A314UH51_PRUYE|nr:uncharacterized protein Pyn_19765 [Prunus yedoensis var. nudiflora]